jgi:MFS family permease
MAEDRLLTRAFLLCFAANLLQGLAFNLFLHFPGFLHQLGADEVEIGLVTSAMAVAAIALRPPIGRAMDRRGRRIVILLGGVLHTFVIALYLTVSSLGPWLYAIRVVHGIAEAMLFTALFTYAADHVPARMRTQGLALFGVSGMLPIALAGVLGDALLARFDFSAVFGAALVFAVLSLLLSLPLPQEPRPALGVDPATQGIRAALRQADLQPLWFLGIVFSTVLTAFFIFMRRFVDETGVGTVGLFFSAYTVSALALRVFFGWLPDRMGPRRVLLPALVSLCAGLGWMARAESAGDLALAGVLCGVGHGFTFPILFGLVVTRVPEGNRGTAMAVFTALFDIGMLVGGPTMGAAIDRVGFASMYAGAGLALALGAAIFFAWDVRLSRRRP